jgi:enoyl-CoA hydratase/carnithine racemase
MVRSSLKVAVAARTKNKSNPLPQQSPHRLVIVGTMAMEKVMVAVEAAAVEEVVVEEVVVVVEEAVEAVAAVVVVAAVVKTLQAARVGIVKEVLQKKREKRKRRKRMIARCAIWPGISWAATHEKIRIRARAPKIRDQARRGHRGSHRNSSSRGAAPSPQVLPSLVMCQKVMY